MLFNWLCEDPPKKQHQNRGKSTTNAQKKKRWNNTMERQRTDKKFCLLLQTVCISNSRFSFALVAVAFLHSQSIP